MKLLNRLADRALDWRLGIETGGVVETQVSDDSCHASTVSYRAIGKMLDRLELKPADTFVDIGCGKGRVLLLAALRRVKLSIGVEASPAMAAQADENYRRLHRRLAGRVDVHTSFAETFHYGDCTAGYCFNSFGWKTLRPVLQKIRQDRAEHPFRLCFLNPSPKQTAVFSEQNWTSYDSGSAAGMQFVVMKLA